MEPTNALKWSTTSPLDANIVSTTPITIGDKQYTPLSSTVTHIITCFVITDYHFQTSLDFGPHLEQFCSWYLRSPREWARLSRSRSLCFPHPMAITRPAASSLFTSRVTGPRKNVELIAKYRWVAVKRSHAGLVGWVPPLFAITAKGMVTSSPSAPNVCPLSAVHAMPAATSVLHVRDSRREMHRKRKVRSL